MARSDLLVSLVRSGVAGDQGGFRRTVEALIAEERSKKHAVLAGELADAIAHPLPSTVLTNNGNGARVNGFDDLVLEIVPERRFADLILPGSVT